MTHPCDVNLKKHIINLSVHLFQMRDLVCMITKICFMLSDISI